MGPTTDDTDCADLTPASVLRFGQRNVLYLGFVSLLVPLSMALEGRHPPGTSSLGGAAFALVLCCVVSAAMFLVNSGLVALDLAKRRPVAKALTACALAALFGGLALALRHAGG